jgi:hypothetical protein
MYGPQVQDLFLQSMLESDWKKNKVKLLLLAALSCLLLGRVWQHLFWDAPYRTIFWNEEFLKPVINTLTNLTWHQYVTHPLVDQFIQYFIKMIGIFYALGLYVCWKLDHQKKWMGNYLLVLFLSLLFLAILQTIEKFLYAGMFLEQAIQFSTPLILYLAYFKTKYFLKYKIALKIIIACTFIGHGLFAIGFYPVPGSFIDMVVTVFGASESTARLFLKTVGCLDLAAAGLLFIPALTIPMLYFMTFWGGATALARIIAHIDFELFSFTGHQWVLETLVRIPHALIPLMAIFIFQNKKASI